MSLELDDETREELGTITQPWGVVVEALLETRGAKRERDRERVEALRESRAVKATEAEYQRKYAATEAGKERRRAASRAYRQRRKAS